MTESILEEALRLTTGDRQQAYGTPLDDFTRIIGMINALFAHKLKEPFVPEDWALMMQCCKCSREVNQHKRDNPVDGAGYWNTLDMCHEERKRRAQSGE